MSTALDVNPKMVVEAALKIRAKNFRTVVQAYICGSKPEWLITVGESHWHRHLLVKAINADGSEATFAVLGPNQSGKFGYDLNTKDVAFEISLTKLLSNGPGGVLNMLMTKAHAA